jgi:hypothetical protein
MARRVLFDRRVVPALTQCRGCGAPIVWRRTEAGRFQPVNPDGVAHFATCPDAAAFRRLSRRMAGRVARQRFLL